ncbi:hypothetical protein G9A89_021013 [Geosiphon pyriformis]|nr:hypothetical protein G9A89_021013 [Geosiphon pyriformis]
MKSSLPVILNVSNRFTALKHSLASLVEHIDKLAKKIDISGPIVSQLSPECQPLVIFSSQNQRVNIIMSKSLGVITSDKTVVGVVIMNKFVKVRIFFSGLDRDFFGAGVTINMDNFLACHVFKIEKIPGHLISVWLLFKGKLSVVILGLYAGASAETKFGQTLKINSLIFKAVNSSTFVVLCGDFNKNGFAKNMSFKFCLDLGLTNLFSGHLLVKAPTWGNSKDVEKTIN